MNLWRPRFLPLVLALVLAACSAPTEPPRLDALAPTTGGPGTAVALTGRFYDDVVATFCGLPLVDPIFEGGARVPAAPALLAPGAAYTTLRGVVPAVPPGTLCDVVLVRRGAPVDGATATFGALATITALEDAYAAVRDVSLVVAAPGVLANDTSDGAGALSAQLVADAANGTVVLNADGSFRYTPDAAFTGADAFTYRATDGMATSAVATVAIAVSAPANSVPVAVDAAYAMLQDTALNGVVAASDVDGDVLSFVVTSSPSFGSVALNPTTGSFTYSPNLGYVGADAFTVTVSDGALSDTATITISVVERNDPPVAAVDAYDALGNVPLVVVAASGVLANDTDPNGGAVSAVAETIATTNGGSVVLAADGSFTYVGAAGFTGTDTFTYTVVDAGALTDTGSVTVTVSGRYWFVDAGAGSGGDGRQATPFASLVALSGIDRVDGANDVILLRSGTYAGGLGLLAGQQLIGQGIPADLTATVNGGSVLLLAVGTAPTLTAASGNALTLAAGNTLRGFVAGSAPGAAIAGSAVGTLTVTDVRIDNPAGSALDLTTSGTLAASFGTIAATGGAGAGLRIDGLGGTFSSGAVTISNPTGTGIAVQSSGGSFAFGTTTVGKTNTGTGVEIGGTPTVAFASLAATTSAGAALRATGGATTIPSGSLAATGGPALEAANATLAVALASTSSTSSSTRGVALTNVAGTVALGGGAIGGSAAEAFFVSGGAAPITYAGTITNASGRSVSIATRSAGSVELSGGITDTGTGVVVQNVTGGSVTFSGASFALSTGANPAVTLTSNTGGAIAFTGGGLALTTTSGAGFTATGGGTVSVTGSANTIATQTGTGLTVANTTIAAAGLTFRRIDVGTATTGPANAIVLASTGTTGGLTVTGDGATAGSGGVLQRTTGTTVSLSATHGTQLRFVRFVRPGLHGVLATNVTGALAFERGSIDYDGTSVANAYALRLENTSTNATLTVDGVLFARKLDANPALSVSARGTSVLSLAVRDSAPTDGFASRFTGLFGSAISVVAGDDAMSSARVDVSVTGTTFDAAAIGGANGVSLRVGQNGLLIPTISGNAFDAVGLAASATGVIDVVAIELGQVGASGSPGVISNNTIQNVRATAGAPAPGGLAGFRGMRFHLENAGGVPTHRLRIANNTVLGLASSAASLVALGGADAQVVLENNVFGSVVAPVGAANAPGVLLDVAGAAARLNLDLLGHSIVAGAADGFAPALLMRSGEAPNLGGVLNATVLDNSIRHLNAGIDFARFEMETRSGTTASACLDLRGNALDAATREFLLVHASNGTFARNATSAGNLVGEVVEVGVFVPSVSCVRPVL